MPIQAPIRAQQSLQTGGPHWAKPPVGKQTKANQRPCRARWEWAGFILGTEFGKPLHENTVRTAQQEATLSTMWGALV